MYEIMLLSGQEYVDEYASHVKSGAVDVDEALPIVVPPELVEDLAADPDAVDGRAEGDQLEGGSRSA